jgi:hypothetical protein
MVVTPSETSVLVESAVQLSAASADQQRDDKKQDGSDH